MSGYHQDNVTATQISSSGISSTRPRQEGKLALLPTEILLQIVNETELIQDPPKQYLNRSRFPPKKSAVFTNILSATDLKNLALASSSMFQRVGPMYYHADNSYAFRSALKHSDIDAMKRCAEFGAAPDMHWELEDECKCKGSVGHQVHRPIDVLLESVKNGAVPIGKSIEALQWLLDNGYEAYEQKLQPKILRSSPESANEDYYIKSVVAMLETESMPEILILTLAESSNDRNRTEGLCQMVRMLRSHGCLLPYNLNVYDREWIDEYDDDVQCPDQIRNPLNVAMMSHCPPHFLGVVLKLYKLQKVNLQKYEDECPETMTRWVGVALIGSGIWPSVIQDWGHESNLGNLAWNLFRDLLDPARAWKEAYNGELADIFDKKIKLLIKYNFVTVAERKVLQSILEAFRRIANMAESLGGLDKDRDGKKCWNLLCDALRPFAGSDGGMSYFDSLPLGFRRVHVFFICKKWNPWSLYYNMLLQDKNVWDEPFYPWLEDYGLRKERGVMVDHVFNQDEVLWEIYPSWIGYDYDGYLESYGERWMKMKEEERQLEEQEEEHYLSSCSSKEEEKEEEDEHYDDFDGRWDEYDIVLV